MCGEGVVYRASHHTFWISSPPPQSSSLQLEVIKHRHITVRGEEIRKPSHAGCTCIYCTADGKIRTTVKIRHNGEDPV